jgi:plasmid maintenance system antidote protein VapI
MSNRQNFWDLMAAKTQQEIADHLATDRSVVSKIISSKRGFSPEVARKIAAITGDPAPTLYIKSQLASMEHKAATKSMSEAGFMGSAQHVMRNCTKQFRPDEMRAARKDPEFVSAANRLRELLLKALDLVGPEAEAGDGNDQGPVYVTGDSTAVAASKSTRDGFGRKIPEGEPVQRDGYDRRVERK